MDNLDLRIDPLAYPSFDAEATQRGMRRRGHFLLSGSFTPPVSLLPGAPVSAEFGRLGRVCVTAAAAG